MRLIGIYSKNRFEWLVSDWACIIFGLTTVPLYDTLGIDNLSFCLNQTEISTMFASLSTIKTLLKLKDHGKLQTIISYDEVDK
jgi:long-chain acyl-CoA synthetase